MKGGGGKNNLGTNALNMFNNNMVKLDDIDNVWDSKHGCYSEVGRNISKLQCIAI